MGKALVFLTLAFSLGTLTVSHSTTRSTVDAEQGLSAYQEGVVAREIARSAYNTADERLRRDFTTWRSGYSNVALGDGTFSVRVEGPAVGPVDVVTFGTAKDNSFHIRAKYIRLAELPWAMMVDADSAQVAYTGSSFTISGADVRPPSLTSGVLEDGAGETVRAVKTDDSAIADAFTDAFGVGQAARVTGLSASADVSSGMLPSWLEEAYTVIDSLGLSYVGDQSFFNDTMGSSDVPVMVSVDGSATLQNVTGYGVMVVNGGVTLEGSTSWEGIIWVRGEGDVAVSLGDDARVCGAFIIQQDQRSETITVIDESVCDYTKPEADSPDGDYVDPNNSNKRLVCHIPPGNPENAHTISISQNAVQTHIDHHDDYDGPCECSAGTSEVEIQTGVLDFTITDRAVIQYSAEALGRLIESMNDLAGYSRIVMQNYYAAPSKLDKDWGTGHSQTGSAGADDPAQHQN